MTEILVVANETLGGRRLRELLEQKAKTNPSLTIRLVIPQSLPRRGSVIYLQSVRDVAQVRLDLALARARRRSASTSTGEIGDSDPFNATMDAIADRKPDEIVISTLPSTASGWLRRDLVERVAEASGIAVQHVISDLDEDSPPPNETTLVVANRTAVEPRADRASAGARARTAAEAPLHRRRARTRRRRESRRRGPAAPRRGARAACATAGLTVAGLVGDPDPFTATLNALQFFRVSRVVISTLPETKSGWLRADLIERVRRYAACPVEHVVAGAGDAVTAN